MAGKQAANANSAVTVMDMGRMSDSGSTTSQQPVMRLNPEIDEILQTPAAVLVPEAQQ